MIFELNSEHERVAKRYDDMIINEFMNVYGCIGGGVVSGGGFDLGRSRSPKNGKIRFKA